MRASDAAVEIRALPVGAEVLGLVEGAERDPAIRAALYRAWLDHALLIFRNINTIERHLALSRCFGELEIHPMPEVRAAQSPYLITLGGKTRGPAYVFDGELRINRVPWHRDTAYTPDLCKGAMLRMLEVPEHEGETLVADTAQAYDDLPAEMKTRLGTLEYKATLRLGPITQTRPGALWKTVRLATDQEDPGGPRHNEDRPEVIARYPSVVHPAVLTHPESGRRCIFLSPTYVDHFLGIEQSDSDDLLAYLVRHMLQPRYIYRHKWLVDDALIWDNRRCMHAGMGNQLNEPRWGLRTTLAGPMAVGRYFQDGASAPDLPRLPD